jgi:hypothetical protein
MRSPARPVRKPGGPDYISAEALRELTADAAADRVGHPQDVVVDVVVVAHTGAEVAAQLVRRLVERVVR